MNFQETLDFLYSQLPVFHKQGASAYKKDLSRTLKLLNILGNPHLKFKSIHVAGTNGKGSTSHFLASVLKEAGYKTGLYTSPHIKHFGERIKVNGQFISEDFVIEFVKKITPYLQTIEPSFFELTVAMAFSYFEQQKVEVAVVEAGLGGRLDSTNVITPVLSVITNISYDHTDLLGDTLKEIAFEKAGIIKEKVPVVISERQNEVLEVFLKKASELNARLIVASELITVVRTGTKRGRMSIKVTEDGISKEMESGLSGLYQLKNIAGVLASCRILQQQGIGISEKAISDGLSEISENTGLKGRWQIIDSNPLTICDIAHNPAGISEVLQAVSEINPDHLLIVLGMVKDKDVSKVLQLLPSSGRYYFAHAHIQRALNAAELAERAKIFGLSGLVYENVNEALKAARRDASASDLILVCGSTFLIAEVDEV